MKSIHGIVLAVLLFCIDRLWKFLFIQEFINVLYLSREICAAIACVFVILAGKYNALLVSLQQTSIALLVVGCASNVLDEIVYSGAIDYIYTYISDYNVWIWNLADLLIWIGVAIVICGQIISRNANESYNE